MLATTQQERPANKLLGSVVDVFCGVGGLSHGFVLEGFNVQAGIDIDEACRYAYEKNNNADFHAIDVDGLTGAKINSLFGKQAPRILIGCAPCQPFSAYSFRNANKKWKLLSKFRDLIIETEPDIVSMENVPMLVRFQGGKLFNEFVESLKASGYSVWHDIVNCADYGVPQARKRLVLLASKIGPIELEPPTHSSRNHKTVGDTIKHLPPIVAGEQHPQDPLHRASTLSSTNLTRIQASKPGGSWRDWDKDLIAACHQRETGKSYSGVYGRMTWDAPAPTITTKCTGFGNGRFGHPEQDRAISLREAALLQSFPETYKFFDSSAECRLSHVRRWIGNAVPVELARAVARSIAKTINTKGKHNGI